MLGRRWSPTQYTDELLWMALVMFVRIMNHDIVNGNYQNEQGYCDASSGEMVCTKRCPI